MMNSWLILGLCIIVESLGLQCNVTNDFIDECEQRCECQSNQTIKCFRIRESYQCMSDQRRERFNKVYQSISEPNHPLFQKMVDLIQRHSAAFTTIHIGQ